MTTAGDTRVAFAAPQAERFYGLGERATQADYRGCGFTNAAVEYPEADHPARAVSLKNKQALRARLRAMAAEMGAGDPERLARAERLASGIPMPVALRRQIRDLCAAAGVRYLLG